nr:MAG TPA: Endodeoxyribonuclease RusA [Bacteriophage sp.]
MGMTLKFIIGLDPITKKNHGQIIRVGGRPRMIPSKQYIQYDKDCAVFMPHLPKPIDYPVTVSAQFFKSTRRAYDLVNALQALLDILVKYGVLADDNANVVFSVDGSRAGYDKAYPRTEVEITGEEPDGRMDNA